MERSKEVEKNVLSVVPSILNWDSHVRDGTVRELKDHGYWTGSKSWHLYLLNYLEQVICPLWTNFLM